jgi:hypothetical protein
MGDFVDMAELDQSVCQETERPAAPTRWWASAGQGNKVGFLVTVEHSWTARCGATNEGTIKTTFDEGTSDPMDSDRSEVQSVTDLLVGPRRAKGTAIRLQQDARPRQLTRRGLAFGHERFQPASFLDRQTHDESLVHDRTPSRDPGEATGIGQKSEELINIRLTGH